MLAVLLGDTILQLCRSCNIFGYFSCKVITSMAVTRILVKFFHTFKKLVYGRLISFHFISIPLFCFNLQKVPSRKSNYTHVNLSHTYYLVTCPWLSSFSRLSPLSIPNDHIACIFLIRLDSQKF